MSTSRPPLFGRVTALATDHESLARGLRVMDELCSGLVAGVEKRTSSSGVELLIEWRNELARHFEAEESDAYFGVIREERRSLRSTVDALERDHARLLAMTDRMIVLFDTRRWSDFVRIAGRLNARFRVHERLEGTLMRKFLTESGE